LIILGDSDTKPPQDNFQTPVLIILAPSFEPWFPRTNNTRANQLNHAPTPLSRDIDLSFTWGQGIGELM
jgi:hypothetical protein